MIALSATGASPPRCCSRSTTSSTTFDDARAAQPIDIPEVTAREAGEPRTFLILGSDAALRRQASSGSSRARTRSCSCALDPDTERDRGDVDPARPEGRRSPGYGTDKINAAYELGGPRLTVATVKQLFTTPGEPSRSTTSINVNFGGFRRAVNYIGGVYVDIDRRYFNDNSAAAEQLRDDRRPARLPEAQGPGRARLRPLPPRRQRPRPRRAPAGLPAPDRATSAASRKLLDVGDRATRSSRGSSRRYFEVDKGLRQDEADLRAAQARCSFTGQARAGQRGAASASTTRRDPASTLDRLARTQLAQDRRRVPERAGLGEAAPRPRRHAGRPQAPRSAQAQAQQAAPTSRASSEARARGREPGRSLGRPASSSSRSTSRRCARRGSRYAGHRAADLHDPRRARQAHQAYRLVLSPASYGEYYGVQGMTWSDPPILDDPDEIADGRRPQAAALLRRQPAAARGLADRRRRLLGLQHAHQSLAATPDARASPASLRRLEPAVALTAVGCSALMSTNTRTDRRHRHRLRRPGHGRRLRRARQRGLLHRHRRGEDRRASSRAGSRSGSRGWRSSSRATATACTSPPTSPTRSSTRGCCSSPSARRPPTRATPTSPPSTRWSTRCRPPTATRW